uniref:Ribonuclease P/MRP 38 subunit n=1 Tax=Neogobius melanostomus TaxID=47308 RepID=A0A8C6V0X9_9GOBI
MTTPKNPQKKAARRFVQSKAYFSSPFSTQWSPLPQEDMHFILKTVKDQLISSGFQKKEVKMFRQWRKKNKAKAEPPQVPKVKSEGGEVGWTDPSVRRQLAIGINEVTKALERNELQLLLVCKSVRPRHMTEHLISLSASRAVPACQVPRLSVTLAQPLGLKSVLALGFRRPLPCQSLLFSDAIEAIAPRVPALSVPWLQTAQATDALQDSESPLKEEGEKRGLKRKLESDSNQTPANSLQPLKVKKIVANPAKKRKEKSKKQKHEYLNSV